VTVLFYILLCLLFEVELDVWAFAVACVFWALEGD
jgi:hypothetical protein